MARSRLSSRMEKETKRNIALAVGGIIIVALFMVKLGLPLLTHFAFFLSQRKEATDTTQQQDSTTFISPPTLNATYSATNSAQLTITGQAQAKQRIKLYVNDSVSDTTMTKDDGSFVFQNVDLTSGNNAIKAKAAIGDKTSSFSNELDVVYAKKAPDLSVDNPADGATVKSQALTVTGKTSSDASVTVNDHIAIVNGDGSFSYTMQLQNGDNQLKVVAQDSAGNQTEKNVKVTYAP